LRHEKCIQYFGWKPEVKRSHRRPRRRGKDNIRINFIEIT